MMTLMERFDTSGATKMEEIAVIDLLKQDDSVIGAVALNENGEMVIITADSTILATGGGARVYDISTNSSSGTGDGFAMGYRAGAELIDMEMVQFHPTGAVYPYDARGRLITEAVRGEGGILKNILGERFMEKYDPVRKELSTGMLFLGRLQPRSQTAGGHHTGECSSMLLTSQKSKSKLVCQ